MYFQRLGRINTWSGISIDSKNWWTKSWANFITFMVRGAKRSRRRMEDELNRRSATTAAMTPGAGYGKRSRQQFLGSQDRKSQSAGSQGQEQQCRYSTVGAGEPGGGDRPCHRARHNGARSGKERSCCKPFSPRQWKIPNGAAVKGCDGNGPEEEEASPHRIPDYPEGELRRECPEEEICSGHSGRKTGSSGNRHDRPPVRKTSQQDQDYSRPGKEMWNKLQCAHQAPHPFFTHQHPVIEVDGPVPPGGNLLVVGDHNDRETFLGPQLLEEFHHHDRALVVQVPGRLIPEQELWDC